MKKISLIAKGVTLAITVAGGASADNNPSHLSSVNQWSGFYAGVNAGLNFNNVQLSSEQPGFANLSGTCNTSSDFSTFTPGIQLGYMFQSSNDLVSGIEANVTFNSNQNGVLNCTCPFNPNVSDSFALRNKMQSSIKGRGGRALIWNQNILLPYLTAGASFANAGLTYQNDAGDFYSQNATQAGWLLGAGLEWSFKKNWSLRAEYAYVDYGNAIKLGLPNVYGLEDPDGNARVALNTNNILLAIIYWF